MTIEQPISIPTIYQPPRPCSHFVGRGAEIEAIIKELTHKKGNSSSYGCIVNVYGDEGIGKSELAYKVASQLQSNFSSPQIYVTSAMDIDKQSAIRQILETIIHILDPFVRLQDDIAELQKIYFSLLKDRSVVIIVDNTNYEEVAEILDPPPTCVLFILSRLKLRLTTAYCLELGKFASEDIKNLHQKICPEKKVDTSTLSNLIRYSPQIARLYLTLLADDLIQGEEGNSQLSNQYFEKVLADDDQGASLTDSLQLIFDQLDPLTRKIFCRLGVFNCGFTQVIAAMAIITPVTTEGIKSDQLKKSLELLCRKNLLTFDKETRYYRISNGIRVFALKHLANPDETYLNLARSFAKVFEDCLSIAQYGSDGLLISLLMFDEHKTINKQIWSWLQQQKNKTEVIDSLVLKYYKIIDEYGRLRFFPNTELIPQLEIAVEAAQRQNDQTTKLSVLGGIGRTYHMLGEISSALRYYNQQLQFAQKSGFHSEEVKILQKIKMIQSEVSNS